MDVVAHWRLVIAAGQVIDAAALERLTKLGGDELVMKMIDLFLLHAEPKASRVRPSFEANDLEEVERLAHSIRSSAGNLGAEELRESSGEIEQLASDRATAGLADAITRMETAFARVKERLELERKARAS